MNAWCISSNGIGCSLLTCSLLTILQVWRHGATHGWAHARFGAARSLPVRPRHVQHATKGLHFGMNLIHTTVTGDAGPQWRGVHTGPRPGPVPPGWPDILATGAYMSMQSHVHLINCIHSLRVRTGCPCTQCTTWRRTCSLHACCSPSLFRSWLCWLPAATAC